MAATPGITSHASEQDRPPGGSQRPEGEFVTELFERCKRMTGDVEEAILEIY
jgi:hypothetical protein